MGRRVRADDEREPLVADDLSTRSAPELRRALRAARKENQQLRRQLEQVRESSSFRLGHRLVGLAARLRPGATPPADPKMPKRRSGVRRLGPTTPTSLLLDATELDAAATVALARRLSDEGHRPVIVHPEPLDLGDLDTEQVVRTAVPETLATRFGPAATLRAVALEGQLGALQIGARPIQHLVDDPGDAAGLPPGPVFIGGTGRSGTWALGRLLGAHPRVVTVRSELRLHASRPGFAEVLSGDLSPEQYAEEVRERWMRATGSEGQPKGLFLLLGQHEVRERLEAFVDRAREDVPGALAQLLHDLVDPYARGRGAVRWVETTPDNAGAAAALTSVLPTARVVHTIRDGRDVASSLLTMSWGPDDLDSALAWWARRIRAADASMAAADPGRVHTVRLEELVHLDRDATLRELLGTLDYRDDEAVWRGFATQIDASRGHVGRWRETVDVDQRDAFAGRYRELIEEMAAEGVTSLPTPPEVVDDLAGSRATKAATVPAAPVDAGGDPDVSDTVARGSAGDSQG
jgi:hypothetical protein